MDLKTIDIKGKDYVMVHERIRYFNETYTNGMILPILMTPIDKVNIKGETIVVKAIITPDCANDTRYFTAYSQEVVADGYINETSALENCETSAVGRALGMMGIGIIGSFASADEVKKAQNRSIPEGAIAAKDYQPKANLNMETGNIEEEPIPEDNMTYEDMVSVTSKPWEGKWAPAKVGDLCRDCGGKMILNPKTSKIFCQEKCFAKK